MRWQRCIRLLAVACLVACAGAASASAQSLTIRFLDVGQGDAALVVTPEGQRALIDAGPSGAGVANYVRALGYDTLDLVVASHNHADHIGGMAAVLQGAVVRFYLDNGLPHTTATYRRTILRRPGTRTTVRRS
jgi:competence protein ComEC